MRFVSYSKLQNWSVQYTRAGGFGYSNKYPLGRIGSFLHRSGVVIEIANNIEYSQVTVRTNNGGVCLRGTKLGKEIGTKRQIKVSKGQYIVSKIDARNGAFGIIPDELDGAIVTNDFNLNKVASIQGIRVLNINDLANAVKPVVIPGEEMTAYLLREGKESGQAIAYLQDGTMIVVEGGRKYIGNKIRVAVTSVLQTSAGRMIFAKVPKNHDVRDMLAGAEGK